ncbi:hypothetical protein PRIPAC_90053, partial [Pristionchus pacificus]
EAPFSLPKKIEEEYVQVLFGVKKEFHHGKLFHAKKYKSRDGTKSIVIKKCRNPLQSTRRAKLLLRHLNLLRVHKHENIVRLLGSYSRLEDKVKSVYTVTEYAGEPMSEFIKKGTYSMADVIHRNFHPGNICIDEDNKLTLIVDIWSISALLCDLLTGVPLFSDSDNSSEISLKMQLKYCGGMTQSVIDKVRNDKDKTSLQTRAAPNRTDFITRLLENLVEDRGIVEADIRAEEKNLRDFVEQTLVFDPDRRRMCPSHALAPPVPSLSQEELCGSCSCLLVKLKH